MTPRLKVFACACCFAAGCAALYLSGQNPNASLSHNVAPLAPIKPQVDPPIPASTDAPPEAVNDPATQPDPSPEVKAVSNDATDSLSFTERFSKAADNQERLRIISEITESVHDSASEAACVSTLSSLYDATSDPALKADILVHAGMMESPAGFPLVIRGINKRESSDVRAAALIAAGLLHDERALSYISNCLKDPDPAVSQAAQHAMEEFQAE